MKNGERFPSGTSRRFFRCEPSDGFLFYWNDDSRESRLLKQKCHFVGVRATQKEKGGLRSCGSRNTPPMFTKRGSLYRLQKQGFFCLFSWLLEAATDDHETICFTEHPPQAPAHTPSGLRAGNPAHHKSFPMHRQAGASQNQHR